MFSEPTSTKFEHHHESVMAAYTFAYAAHAAVKQKRKYSQLPYIVHPIHVANLVQTVPQHTSEMIMAALLHDVVEDTGVEQSTIRELFGEKVGCYVDWLTDTCTLQDGNRATRKLIYANRLKDAPDCVHTIKLCDITANASSIARHDPGFARKWLKESIHLTQDVLVRGDAEAHHRANELLTNLIKGL